MKLVTEQIEVEKFARDNEELKASLLLKDAQILDLSGQIAVVRQTLSETTLKNTISQRQLSQVKRIQPMLDIRGNYINGLEEKIRDFEQLCSDITKENLKLKYEVHCLKTFRFHSLLASMDKTTNLLQTQY